MLIFKNGVAIFKKQSSVTFDDNGHPLPSVAELLEVVCNITTLSENKKGTYEDGRYKNCTYSILIDYSSVDDNFNPVSVELTHDKKGNIGEFTIQRIEYYSLTKSIEIWV